MEPEDVRKAAYEAQVAAGIEAARTHPSFPPDCSCAVWDHDAEGNCRCAVYEPGGKEYLWQSGPWDRYGLACIMAVEWTMEMRRRQALRPVLKEDHTPASDPAYEAYVKWMAAMDECHIQVDAWLAWGPRPKCASPEKLEMAFNL